MVKKFADESGSAVAESIADYLGPILDGSVDTIKGIFSNLLKSDKNKDNNGKHITHMSRLKSSK